MEEDGGDAAVEAVRKRAGRGWWRRCVGGFTAGDLVRMTFDDTGRSLRGWRRAWRRRRRRGDGDDVTPGRLGCGFQRISTIVRFEDVRRASECAEKGWTAVQAGVVADERFVDGGCGFKG